MDKKAIEALKDMVCQIENEEWAIYTNDRGSGSAGVSYIDDVNIIKDYLFFAETGDNKKVPHCNDIYYIPSDDFENDDDEVINEVLEYYGDYFNIDEVLGLVVCEEHYDMDYTFYMVHIK